MTSTWTWAQVITSIKGVAARTSGGYSQSTVNKYGIDTGSGAWMYIPANAYYTTGSWVNIPWNTIKGKLGAATTGEVLKDKTFSSSNGVNIKGTIESKTSGNSSVTASGKWGIDTTNGMWMYIPANAYYTTGHWLNVPWATCSGKIASFGSIKTKSFSGVRVDGGSGGSNSSYSYYDFSSPTGGTRKAKVAKVTFTESHYVVGATYYKESGSIPFWIYCGDYASRGDGNEIFTLSSNSITGGANWRTVGYFTVLVHTAAVYEPYAGTIYYI